MIIIDGSSGEGGGQILRTSLALSCITGQPFSMHHIRAGRKNPGLRPQHLASVNAAARISRAEFSGAHVGSQNLLFTPKKIYPGSYNFSIGTAGSTTLVFQTVLPPLMMQSSPSTLHLEGGTHNPLAPHLIFWRKHLFPCLTGWELV